tara:strand:+ start:71 stop:307 length:237 start_codon:yes stop_codon:yes gene_type:complete
MDKSKLFKIIPGAIALVLGVAAVMFFVIKLLWAWTIPDLFPGAVEQGLIAAEISWLTSFKLALFLGIVRGITVNNSKS